MEHEPVDPFAEGPVAQCLDVAGMALPFLLVGRRERLGAQDGLAVDVGGRGHLRAPNRRRCRRSTTRTRPSAHRPGPRRSCRRSSRRRPRSRAAARAGAPARGNGRRSSPPPARRSSAAGPTGTARRSPGCPPPARSSPAGRAEDRSRAAAGTLPGKRGVQFCDPTSQLSMCVATSVFPASGLESAMSLPISPSNIASAALRLSLSHSSPRPSSGAGWLSLPVGVWPKRTTVHLPGGTSHASRPSLRHVRSQVTDAAARDGLLRRQRARAVRAAAPPAGANAALA